MLYLGGSQGWVRKDLIKAAVGDPVSAPGERAERTINNGSQATPPLEDIELGKRIFEMKVDYAVRQIKQLLAARATTASQP